MSAMNIAEKMNRTDWCKQELLKLQQELDVVLEHGVTIPEEPGGWWHQYVCPEHHTELLFDPAEEDATVFHCPHGCRIEEDVYRGAWLVFKHQSIARYALQAAAVYAGTGEARYAELGKTILVRYAEQFPHYPVHPDAQPWMLKGRAFHQALTEGIWSTTLIRAYLLLQDEGVGLNEDQPVWEKFLDMLEESMVEYRRILIHDKKNPENNYTAWLNASLSCVYAARGQQKKLEELIAGEGGLQHHLTIGVKPDQFEFEGATYYHVFVLRAYMITVEMAERFGIDLYHLRGDQEQCFKGMYDVLADLANGQGELPALHDGPYKRVPYAREIAEIMEIGFAKYGQPSYVPILQEAYRQLGGEPLRSGLEAVVYGEADLSVAVPDNTSKLLPDSGFAVGRQPGNALSFLTDFGAHGGSHGHYDKLHVSVEHRLGAISPDMGMVPYGSEMRKSWFAQTASHNTVAVGAKSQKEHTGEYVKWEQTPQSTYIWTRSAGAYEGCIINRHVLLTGDLLIDWVETKLDEANDIDLFFHSLYPFIPASDTAQWGRSGEKLGTENGYEYIHVTGMTSTAAGLVWKTGTHEAAELYYASVMPVGGTVYYGETPGTSVDPSEAAYVIVQRTHGTQARYVQAYRSGSPAQLEMDGDMLIVQLEEKQMRYMLSDQGLVLVQE
ncbi:heparinase II/III domain-containing protein [Paenibacillus thalictri]|uniref:Heparinase n=1 Tax=Paenibacillus thalictri TaxID=2527873 RepID=A0A4Q9DS75_9BACL|nr:heparinase II/III family protein [Paenibacillus thalictri]TBL78246.1 heparinase [Paenibacillus thalictri]